MKGKKRKPARVAERPAKGSATRKAPSGPRSTSKGRKQGPAHAPEGTDPDLGPRVAELHSKGPATERDGRSPFPIVGVGASAGGFDAFRAFLSELPADPGMAFVLVQHLAPLHESALSALLSKSTILPVVEAKNGERVQRNHVYTIPPNFHLAILGGTLILTPRPSADGPFLPVDHLFRSLAEEEQSSAIGVVLSGTGPDGTLGLCEIKAVGGITFAQDERSSAHSGMPISARNSGCVDFVAPPEEIAKRLVQIGAHPYLASRPTPPELKDQDAEERYRRILARVRQVMGVDFSMYRNTTIRRRIMRRMALHGQNHLKEYAARLEGDRDEVEALYHDLLINVTSFFRDPEMFEALKTVVFPTIAKRKKAPGQPYRVWVPGCSTGQEAYSIAMSLIEFFDERPVRPSIQVFATDLSDQTALEKARSGVYPQSIEAEVSPERLRRFFKRDDSDYRIDKSIRDMCIFARQNVTADPPFSHLDLISCRNVLIYLATPLQKRVMPTFHYALDVPGFLVLGAAESIGEHGDLFEVVDRTHKIYAKKAVPSRSLVYFSPEEHRASPPIVARRAPPPTQDFAKEADRLLLGRFSPPAVLLNEQFDVLQYRGRTSPYLEAPSGEPTANVLKLAREGLFLELRGALLETKRTGRSVRRKVTPVLSDTGSRDVVVEVLPIKPSEGESACYLVVFHDAKSQSRDPNLRPTRVSSAERAQARKRKGSKSEADRLRQELASTKEYLQSLAEQQDAANEELRSANEEILSSNEELQSTNEELETAKEELQSTNEELTTVNEQLQHRNVELTQVANDLTNLLSSTNIPLVMVGNDLRIRRFTGAAKRIMNLLPSDVGRPIGDFRIGDELSDLEGLITDVIERVHTVEREVRDRDGRWYTLRVSPYRTLDHKIDGAVLLLVDVDQIRRGQEELQHQAAVLRQQAALIELSHDAIIVRDAHGRVMFWNHGASEMYGHSADDVQGKPLTEVIPTDSESWARAASTLERTGSWEGELRQRRRDGRELLVQSREILIRGGDDDFATVLSINRDVTESKRVMQALKHADRQKDQFLATLAHELRNPIAPIRNAVEIMRRSSDDPDTIQEVRDVLDRQVRQLARIVEDLIDVSRIVERKIDLHLERLSVDVFVKTAIETTRPLIEACRHTLTVEVPVDPLYLDVDPVRMSQVLVNLLNNAAKFTPRGGRIWLTVETAASQDGPGLQARIRVRDTGIGIPEESRAQIFDMFEQGSAKPLHGAMGLGVGLTLVRSLVQMHGGSVEVSSPGVGQGSEFVLRLPLADLQAPEPRPPSRSGDAARPGRGPPKRVLIVDDNRDQADSLGKMLGLMGHEIRLAYDGEEALRVAESFVPDVALVDIGLPKFDGFEVARRFRADPKLAGTLLVAQTGWGQEQDRQRTKAAGFQHHLVKPTDAGVLYEILARAGTVSERSR